jgi:hypothetical protein
MVRLLLILLGLFVAFAGVPAATYAQSDGESIAELTYVSAEGVYFNAGSEVGLRLGDTLEIRRGNRMIATVVINNISSQSAAAIILEQTEPVLAGDRLFAVSIGSPIIDQPIPKPSEPLPRTAPKSAPRGRMRGELAFSNYLHRDLSGADLSWMRPGLASRFSIENIGDAGLTFEFRHRTRLYHRSREVRVGEGTDEWSHQVYEMALLHDQEGVATEWGIGRIIAPYVRGVGLIDGGYYARSVSEHYKVGVAGGTSPDPENSGLDFGRRKLGVFVAFEAGRYDADRLGLSAALSTEYDHSTVSRDFLYLQGTFSRFGRLNTYHSVEIDWNRSWRYEYTHDRLKLTNYFGSATLTLHRNASVFVSYDTRRNIRYFENRNIPDSLFDALPNKGVRGGFSLRFSDRVSMRASGGIRMRDDFFDDAKNGSISFRLSRFPARRHTMSAFFSYVKTQFTTGYRPLLVYRFPVMTRLLMTLTGAAHFYDTGTRTTSNYYTDLAGSYAFRSGLFINGSYRQYYDSDLESVELFTELGYRW